MCTALNHDLQKVNTCENIVFILRALLNTRAPVKTHVSFSHIKVQMSENNVGPTQKQVPTCSLIPFTRTCIAVCVFNNFLILNSIFKNFNTISYTGAGPPH